MTQENECSNLQNGLFQPTKLIVLVPKIGCSSSQLQMFEPPNSIRKPKEAPAVNQKEHPLDLRGITKLSTGGSRAGEIME